MQKLKAIISELLLDAAFGAPNPTQVEALIKKQVDEAFAELEALLSKHFKEDV